MRRNDSIGQWLIAAAFVCCLLFACAGCKTTAPSAQTNTARRDSARIEYKHDSNYIDRWHTVYTKGDTVYVYDSIWRDRWHTRHDTLCVNKSDTIYQQVVTEKKSSVFLRNSGIALWVIIALLILSVLTGIIIKFAK